MTPPYDPVKHQFIERLSKQISTFCKIIMTDSPEKTNWHFARNRMVPFV